MAASAYRTPTIHGAGDVDPEQVAPWPPSRAGSLIQLATPPVDVKMARVDLPAILVIRNQPPAASRQHL
jgi:hypothetical protein